METKTEMIFLGGSNTIEHLPPKVVGYLECFMNKNANFMVGDCHGTDLAIQIYLQAKRYRNVTVYCSGDSCRWNIGGWNEKHVTADGFEGYEFYRQKDIAMIEECNGAILLWDGETRGTKNNIHALKQRGVPIFIYHSEVNKMKVTRRRVNNGRI